MDTYAHVHRQRHVRATRAHNFVWQLEMSDTHAHVRRQQHV